MKRKKAVKIAWTIMSIIIMVSMLVWTFGAMFF